MKYVVEVNGERLAVTIGAGGLTVAGEAVSAHLAEVRGSPVSTLTIDGSVYPVRVRRREGRGNYTLWIAGYRYEVKALDERQRTIRDLDVKSGIAAGPARIVAPMPGMVSRVLVAEGDVIHAGQGVLVVEAMKMENELRAPTPGRVSRVHVTAGVAVEKGVLLVELESVES